MYLIVGHGDETEDVPGEQADAAAASLFQGVNPSGAGMPCNWDRHLDSAMPLIIIATPNHLRAGLLFTWLGVSDMFL